MSTLGGLRTAVGERATHTERHTHRGSLAFASRDTRLLLLKPCTNVHLAVGTGTSHLPTPDQTEPVACRCMVSCQWARNCNERDADLSRPPNFVRSGRIQRSQAVFQFSNAKVSSRSTGATTHTGRTQPGRHTRQTR